MNLNLQSELFSVSLHRNFISASEISFNVNKFKVNREKYLLNRNSDAVSHFSTDTSVRSLVEVIVLQNQGQRGLIDVVERDLSFTLLETEKRMESSNY